VSVRVELNVPQVVVTVAVNWAVRPGETEICAGLTATETMRSVTATVEIDRFVGSARLVATT
jgi:hypothetical protein